jgi:hypothetical protein
MDARGGRAGCTLDRKASPTENGVKRTSSQGKIRLRITVEPYNLSVDFSRYLSVYGLRWKCPNPREAFPVRSKQESP